jgi:Domain of unknown function (DUF1707)
MGRDDMRASDGDRDAAASRLRAALDDGRLDLHEYDERLQRAYAAKTYGELSGLLADIPGVTPPQQSQVYPYAGVSPPAEQPHSRASRVASWVGPYAGVVVVSVVIWAITSLTSGQLNYFWPIWTFIPLIFGVTGAFTGKGAGSTDRNARRAARRDRRGR